MKQEDKELLSQELCAMLPYGVKVTWDGEYPLTVTPYIYCAIASEDNIKNLPKLLLRPISSMTEEEKEKYINLRHRIELGVNIDLMIYNYLNFLYSRHIDVSDRLLRKEIALEAPEGMYN